MNSKNEIKHSGILITTAVIVIILVFVFPHAPQMPLFESSAPVMTSELHCAKVTLANQKDGRVEVFCQDNNYHKVILYCDSVKTRAETDGSSTVQCY